MRNNNVIVNCDTDSIMIASPEGLPFSKEQRQEFLKALNAEYPELINFEDDGYFLSVLVMKSKNYAMLDEEGMIKLKGSSIKTSSKEPAMKSMMEEIIKVLLEPDQE